MRGFLRFFWFSAIMLLTTFILHGCPSYDDDIAGNIEDDDTLDTIPPSAIADLRLFAISSNDAEICWTAPGDDNDSGLAKVYDVRISPDSITPANFDLAAIVDNFAFPDTAGTEQCLFIAGLEGEQTYWAALKTRDEANNWSGISNCLRFACLVDSIVIFPDTGLDRAIRLAISRPTEPIRKSHLLSLKNLFADNKGIVDLTGLEYCPALEWLRLPRNSLVDISRLGNLVSLKKLDLVGNQISDISALASLENLEELYATNNPITDIAPLADLTNMVNLSLVNIDVTDFSAVSELTTLEVVDLGANTIENLDVLSSLVNVRVLMLYACHLTDIGALENLTALEDLTLSSNQIIDITPLSTLPNLIGVDLSGNSIIDIVPLVNNPGLGEGDTVILTANPLSSVSISEHIPALQARGVTVTW